MGKLIDQAKRARARAAKGDRKRQIRSAALDSFVNQPYVDVTLDSICLRAKLRKGLAAMYFGSKEELFLDLLQRQLQAWSEALVARLGEPGDEGGEAVAAVVASLEERPILTRLLGLLPVVLEQNLDVSAALAFRQRQRRILGEAGAALDGLGDPVRAVGGEALLRRALLLAGALDPVARPRGSAATTLLGHVDDRPALDLGDEMRAMLAGVCGARDAPSSGESP